MDDLIDAREDEKDAREARKFAEKELDDAQRWLRRCREAEAEAIIKVRELELAEQKV